MRKTKNPLNPIMLIALAMMAAPLTGCSDDERLVSLSQESANRQAEQNRQIVRQSEQVAEATHDLVRQDAAARAELIAAQKDLETSLQSERASLDRQRVALAEERRDLAAARDRAPTIAAAITASAWLLPLALLFALCLYLAQISARASHRNRSKNCWSPNCSPRSRCSRLGRGSESTGRRSIRPRCPTPSETARGGLRRETEAFRALNLICCFARAERLFFQTTAPRRGGLFYGRSFHDRVYSSPAGSR